jgi:NAD(P)-dependent dehydrogenase (short-subunit alcohol dehydrogenase family)
VFRIFSAAVGYGHQRWKVHGAIAGQDRIHHRYESEHRWRHRRRHGSRDDRPGPQGQYYYIISTAGHQDEPWNVGYYTGKSGLLNFTRSVAMELAEFGIRVNSLTPTATDPTEGRERAARWGVQPHQPRSSSPRRRGLLVDMHRGTP